jgi:hypothetical protein
MKKYAKTSYSNYLKSIKDTYTSNSSIRACYGVVHERLRHRQFKLVLPMIPKDNISGKGSNIKPGKRILIILE